jgi:hypothetical protein
LALHNTHEHCIFLFNLIIQNKILLFSHFSIFFVFGLDFCRWKSRASACEKPGFMPMLSMLRSSAKG